MHWDSRTNLAIFPHIKVTWRMAERVGKSFSGICVMCFSTYCDCTPTLVPTAPAPAEILLDVTEVLLNELGVAFALALLLLKIPFPFPFEAKLNFSDPKLNGLELLVLLLPPNIAVEGTTSHCSPICCNMTSRKLGSFSAYSDASTAAVMLHTAQSDWSFSAIFLDVDTMLISSSMAPNCKRLCICLASPQAMLVRDHAASNCNNGVSERDRNRIRAGTTTPVF